MERNINKAPTDETLMLIKLVRENPKLYNHNLPPHQRRQWDIVSGWQDVADKMGKNYTRDKVLGNWNTLVNTYHHYRLSSPEHTDVPKWKYFKELDFIADVYQPKLKRQRLEDGNDPTAVVYPTTSTSTRMTMTATCEDNDDLVDDVQSDAALSLHSALVSDESNTSIQTAIEESVEGDSQIAHDDDVVDNDMVDHDGHHVESVPASQHHLGSFSLATVSNYII